MKWILIPALLVSTMAWSQGKPSDVVATVGTKKITLEEFNRKYKEVTSQVLVNPPNKKVFLEDLVRYEVGLQEARKRGLEKDPIVQDRMNQELYKGLLEKELGAKVQENKVSEGEMKAWYANNPQLRISDILIDVKPGATPEQRAEAKKRAGEILDDVKKSKRPFEELVRLYSDDPTTKNLGGDIGWQSRLSLIPPFYNAAVSLKLNEVSNVVETPFGFHIIKLTGRRTYEEATKREIRMAVFDEKRRAVFDNFFNNVKKNYQINVNSKLVE
ncbi:MAG: peptidylprolyl isomerase [Bdellovibrio sp.]|nr:peptidylprolyl isomerase [Bdellovibrio sp.]